MWSKKHDKCQECGTTEIPHRGHGLCNNCYCRWYHQKHKDRLNVLKRRRRQSPEYKAKERVYNQRLDVKKRNREKAKRWRERHPERLKEVRERFKRNHPNYKTEYSRRPEMKEYTRNYVLNKKYGENAFLVLERDNNTCQKCGSTDDIHIHHIDWNKDNNELDNLILLCNSCHLTLHNFVPEQFRREIFDNFMQNVING